MFNDQILDVEWKRYLKSELKHQQEQLDKVLNYMKLNETNNNTLGLVYSQIFLKTAKNINEIETEIEKINKNMKERDNNDTKTNTNA